MASNTSRHGNREISAGIRIKSSSYGLIKVRNSFNSVEPGWLPAYVNHPRDSEHECVLDPIGMPKASVQPYYR